MTRLPYIDKLKALAMMLVVMGHTIYYCTWHETVHDDAILNIICTFHVPLFFFLSGFVIKEPPSGRKLAERVYRLMLPMLVVGVINAVLIGKVPEFFVESGHNGYWYLLTLTLFYLLLSPFLLIRRKSVFFADILLAAVIWVLFRIALRYFGEQCEPLSLGGVVTFWPYFIAGHLCRKYALEKFAYGKTWLTILLPVCYLTLVIVSFSRLDSLPLYQEYLIAFTAIAALFVLFRLFDGSHTFVDRQLSLIGKSTLDIYIYHYFFIRFIDLSFLQTSSIAIELLVTIPLTLAIVYVTMAIGKAVRALLRTVRYWIAFIIPAFFSLPAMADSYDPDNYKPEIDTVKIDETNLPIIFIDTRYGNEETTVIHKDWRVAARMKIVNNADGINYGDTIAHPGQTADYDGWIAIRYRGNSSFTSSPKKPFSIKTMKTADPEGEKRKAALLGMPKDNSWVLIAPYIDRSQLRDVLMFQLARPYFDYTPRVRHCEVIIDGIYYGIYVLAENIRKSQYRLNLEDPGESGDALTGGYQLQIDRNDEEHYYTLKYPAQDSLGHTYPYFNKIYLQYKHPEYDEMTQAQLDYIHHRIDAMEDALASPLFADPETGYRQHIDVMSFIDQQLSQEVSGNVDGYRLSTTIYKHRDSDDPRFKTAIWDFNLAFGNTGSTGGTRTDFWRYQNSYFTDFNCINKVPFWWMRLMEDTAYVTQLKQRWAQYREGFYSNQHVFEVIDSLANHLEEKGALQRNFTTWPTWGIKLPVPNWRTVNTYDKEIYYIKKWISRRLAWMDHQLGYDLIGIMMPTTNVDKHIVGYYTLKGERIETPPANSIMIVRYSDGTFRKIRTSQ